MFGFNSPLNLSFPVAAKTGTTNDIRDNWTLGYTPDLVTGVWIGNADYTPMVNSSGLSGAAGAFGDPRRPDTPADPKGLRRRRFAGRLRTCLGIVRERLALCPAARTGAVHRGRAAG